MERLPPDPFPIPVAVEVKRGSDLERAIRACLPEPLASSPHASGALIGLRTSEDPKVAGAIVGPPCARCGTRVWLAPSSQRVAPFPAAVCVPCLVVALSRVAYGRAGA